MSHHSKSDHYTTIVGGVLELTAFEFPVFLCSASDAKHQLYWIEPGMVICFEPMNNPTTDLDD